MDSIDTQEISSQKERTEIGGLRQNESVSSWIADVLYGMDYYLVFLDDSGAS